MPAVSESQRRLMAIAEHHPSKLHKGNRGVLKMSHKQLHDFASKDKGFYGHLDGPKTKCDYNEKGYII